MEAKGNEAVLTNRPRRKRRPNASGFAKTDCHTCVQESRTCDRLLPKCEACLDKGVVCGGYVVDLKWSEGAVVVTAVKNGEPNSDADNTGDSTTAARVDHLPITKGKEIKFRIGKPRTKRVKLRDHVSNEGKRESKPVAVKKGASSEAHIQGGQLVLVGGSQQRGSYSPMSMSIESSRSPSPFRLSPSVEYSSLANKMRGVLEMCE